MARVKGQRKEMSGGESVVRKSSESAKTLIREKGKSEI